MDGFILKTFKVALISFWVVDKLNKTRFFLETFLLADISAEMVLDILFLNFSNANIQFTEKELIWRFYTSVKSLLIS